MFDSLREMLTEAKRQVEAGDTTSAAKTLDNAVSELEAVEMEWQHEQQHAEYLEMGVYG